MDDLGLFLNLVIPLLLLVLGFFAGRWAEHRHYKSIRRREKQLLHVPAVSSRTLPGGRPVDSSRLALGSVVVSVDHFKRFLTSFRKIFGGELRSYSPLIDRGRREAVLRMKESQPDADLFLNCRLETAPIFNGAGKATGSVEIVAYSTAIKFTA